MKGTGDLRLSDGWKVALGRFCDDTYTKDDFELISNPPEPCRAKMLVGAFADVTVAFGLVLFAAAKAEQRNTAGKVRVVSQSMLRECRELLERHHLGGQAAKIMVNPDWWNLNDGLSTLIRSKVAEIFFERTFYNRKVQGLLPHCGFYNDMRQVAVNDSVVYPGGWASIGAGGRNESGHEKSSAAKRVEAQLTGEAHI
jgi:hypothetical protein